MKGLESTMRAMAFVLAMLTVAALAQQESTRQLWNTEFLKKRPSGKSSSSSPQANYRPADPVKVAPGTEQSGKVTMLGVTPWRLRASKQGERTRLLVLDNGGAKVGDQTPERVETNTLLAAGDRVRLTVEAVDTGYLYVIDREQYSDGTLSDPYLIYPNWQTRVGDNLLAAGRLIEIPDQRDQPNSFTIRASQPSQVAEVLTLLISPQQLPDLRAGRDPLKLDAAKYAEWEKKWGAKTERFELDGGAGKTWTNKEKAAGADRGTTLTQDDPLPQTLFRVSHIFGSPFLVEYSLRLGR